MSNTAENAIGHWTANPVSQSRQAVLSRCCFVNAISILQLQCTWHQNFYTKCCYIQTLLITEIAEPAVPDAPAPAEPAFNPVPQLDTAAPASAEPAAPAAFAPAEPADAGDIAGGCVLSARQQRLKVCDLLFASSTIQFYKFQAACAVTVQVLDMLSCQADGRLQHVSHSGSYQCMIVHEPLGSGSTRQINSVSNRRAARLCFLPLIVQLNHAKHSCQ